MSTVIAKNVQIGTSGTATDNFTVFQPATPDGTLRIGNGNTGITTSQVALTSAGNVGIGTSSPLSQSRLTVAQDGTATAGGLSINQTNGLSNRAGGIFLARQDDNRASIESDYFSGLIFSNKSGTGSLTEKMRIDTSGNVGIGTSSPGHKLQVNGAIVSTDGTTTVRVVPSGGVGLVSTITNHPLAFQTNDAEQARITTAGLFQFNSGYGSVATAYGCRAWVNFNGVGTVAIKASGNVSSITDSGVGDFTLNFTTAMPDANYAVTSAGTGAFGVNANIGGWYTGVITNGSAVPLTKTTSAVRVYSAIVGGPAGGGDSTENYFCIFR